MRKIQKWSVCLLAALVVAGGAMTASAQLTRGFISGTVTDASGGILAGVQVTITNKATNISRETVSNETGLYRFAAVEPGEYSVEFKLAGFEARKVDNISVSSAREVTLNQTMTVGGVTAEISVTETPGVELSKTSATIERTFSGRLMVEMPLITNTATSRDINVIGLLAPTVTRSTGQGSFSANGQRARNNNYTIDGIDNNDASVTIASSRVLPEAVQEVQLQTEAYSAEFGRNSGGQLSVVTKGGTNQFHGEGWDYYRGNWMEPVSLFNRRNKLTSTPRFDVNQFGGDTGGPIIRDHTFFFGLVEWNRRREAASANNANSANIPTPTGYAALPTIPLAAGETQAARDAVLSALSFLPSIYPQVANFNNLTNVAINGVPIQVGTILIPLPNPSNFFYSAARVDHKFSDRDNLSYRYHIDKRDQPNAVNDNLAFGTKWTASQVILRQNHALSYTRTLSPRFLNEARFAYVRGNLNFQESDPLSPTVGITGFFTIGGTNSFPQGRLDHTWQFQDVASYTVGHHAIKFGADLRRYVLFNNAGFDTKGTWAFASLANFINNQATSLTQAVNQASFLGKQWNHSYFFQDDFKVKKNLTLNLGMRYEYSTLPFGLFGATDPAVLAVGVPGPVLPDKNNFAPRFGFAYSPTERTAIRGGFGMAYDVYFFNLATNAASNYPRVVNSLTNTPATFNLFPTLAPKVAVAPVLNPLSTFVNTPVNTQDPTTNFWSLSIQRELSKDYILEVGYTGNRSYHGVRQGQTNPPVLTADQAAQVIAAGNGSPVGLPSTQARRLNPNWGSRVTLEDTAKSAYHAGYIKFDRRMSKNLLIGANYTFSGSWSDNDESLAVTGLADSSPQIPEDFFNYRKEWSRSSFDRPNRFAVHYLYEIPWVSSGWASQALGKIMGGWQIAGFVDAQSGQPFTIRTGADSAGIGSATPARPNFNPNGIFKPNYNSTGTLQETSSGGLRTFYAPTDGTGIFTAPSNANGILANSMPGGGNLGRNTLRGPGFQNWNFSMMKKITIKEDVQLQIRSDFSNLLNHNNFANPNNNMSSPTFGQNTAALITDARLILFSAKLKF